MNALQLEWFPFRSETQQVEPVAQMKDVGVSLGGRPVLRDVALEVAAGEVVGISGANGSGKTTLVRTLATLQRPSNGSGRILGVDVTGSDLSGARRGIGLIGHTPALVPELSLRENLTHIARLAGIDVGRVDSVLEVVGLDAAGDRRADAASFGMKRRAEVAHLLLRKPQLLLLDEAGSGLDEAASELIDALIETNTDRGGATVMVSHDRSYLNAKCQRTMHLVTGKLEVNG